MCSTAQNDSERGRCYQRNIVYETFLYNCQERKQKEEMDSGYVLPTNLKDEKNHDQAYCLIH